MSENIKEVFTEIKELLEEVRDIFIGDEDSEDDDFIDDASLEEEGSSDAEKEDTIRDSIKKKRYLH
jgi:hypothetical protein